MSEPAAPVGRWRPVRAGIRNIWEYDDHVFHFSGGRLVLRGPNGSGKSNALALLVPFLLDGVMAANRMDSLSGGRSMKTLLLCLADDERSTRFRHEQRTGYAWLEFERDGEHVTIGCGARASTQRDAEAWFFVTPRRPGVDLELAPGGVPLTRSALADEVGVGAVHESAESYRAAVDRALFGLGPHRYRNLVELLLVLRRPHLAGKLNLEHLSKVLSDGLAALDDQLVVDVAASFDDLEAVQRDLRRLRDAHRSVESFLPTYRRYLRSVARARAVAAGDAARTLRAARRRVAAAAAEIEAAGAVIEDLRLARLACDQRRQVAEQRQRAVLESPAYRDATSLAEVESRATDAEGQLAQASDRMTTAEGEHRSARQELADAEAALARATTETDSAFTAAAEAADLAGVAWPVQRDEVAAPGLERVLRGTGGNRRRDVGDVRRALAGSDRAAAHARAAAEAAALAADDVEQAEATRRAAGQAVDDARAVLADALARWAGGSGIAALDSAADLADLVGEPGAPPLGEAVAAALAPLLHGLAARAARAEDLAAALTGERDAVAAERRRVADEAVPAPDRAATRPADRAGRPGSPLYACCDFAESVPEPERAGLEAALEAAGLLDAWVGETSDDLDAWIGAVPVAAPTLADVLVPTPPEGSGLSADAVRGVLGSVSLADAGVAVRADGRFRLGPLHGRFAKDQAEFVGATAREHRRRRLLAQLDDRLAELAARRDAAAAERAAVAAEEARMGELVATMPSPDEVLSRREDLIGAVAAARATGEAFTRAEAAARRAQAAADAESERLHALAAERRLPATAAALDEVEALVQAYDHQAGALVQAASRLADRRSGCDRATGRAERAGAQLVARRTEHDDLARHLAGLRARVAQLRAQLGADADAPIRLFKEIEGELGAIRAEAERLNGEAGEASERRGRAQQEHDVAEAAVAGHAEAAAGAAARLDVLRRTDVWTMLSGDRGPAEPPPDPLELAGVVVTATAGSSAEADENALQRAYRQLLDELGRGYDPSLSYIDHVAVVEVTSDAGTFSVLWLAGELTAQVARQEDLLSERDREIFERHLLTRVGEALRELLNDAAELVSRINRSLAARPTASGKSVQLRWEPETADPALRDAIGLLRKTPGLLGPDESDRLRRYFATAIARRRAEDVASGYAEILRQVLDYRAWHVFVPHVRSAGGGVQRLTRTLFRSLSGGEQAVVLHLPLFAAAAAHYDAAEGAPRLIALDEAFAGIDEGMRAELMGLLVRFDLDIVLTGHELWGAYQQVPALMVYDLLRQPPLEGVSAFAVSWDGATMAEV